MVGPGSRDPVRTYHVHTDKCIVGEAAPAFILAGEAIETVSRWCGVVTGVVTPPPDQDDPTRRNPRRTTPITEQSEERVGERSGGERTASHRWAPMDSAARGAKGGRRVEGGGTAIGPSALTTTTSAGPQRYCSKSTVQASNGSCQPH